jgi:hypothetical protein
MKEVCSDDEHTVKHAACPSVATVFVLVKTKDSMWAKDWEVKAATSVVGVYGSIEKAEKAKRIATKGYYTNDDENYHQGECFYTSFKIFEKQLRSDDGEEDDEDGDY